MRSLAQHTLLLFDRCRRFWTSGLIALVLACGVEPASAQMCPREQLDAAIDGAGASLRALSQSISPQIQQKMRELKSARGWTDSEYEEKSYAAAQDRRLAELESQSATLLQHVDQLGATAGVDVQVACSRIADATAAGVELQATVRARSQYLMGRLDSLLADARGAASKGSPKNGLSAISGASGKSGSGPIGTPTSQPNAAVQSPNPVASTEMPSRGWNTELSRASTDQAALPKSDAPRSGALQSDGGASDPAQGYSIEEIAAAAPSIFGKASANLAKVLEFAFAKSGRPTGYIIGSEAGGALIAGVRYGKGIMVLRTGEKIPIFWHGPSIGAELGASGAEVLFLIYKLGEMDDIFTLFNGVEGAAYIVGGVGVTYLSNGRVQMAPIRTGVGLRFGANIGYTRFTRRQTWNPF